MLRARWQIGFCLLLVPATARSVSQRGDSLSVLSEAHRAQARFERIRRHYMPAVTRDDDPPCETQIGRMCYYQGDDTDQPVPEPRSTARARQELLATLARLSALSPADDWIAGQRIRYMLESGEDSAAVTLARECAPRRWYCSALEGYALHASQRFAAADVAFDSALAKMPAAERCRWNDISLLLTDRERDSYERLACGQRDSVEQQFWKLARPSFVVDGNDRRTEHFSRILLADLSETSANPYDLLWGPDMRELLIRYGPATWYTTARRRPLADPPPPIGHDRVPSFHFAAEMDGDSAYWDAQARVARERYAPPYMDSLARLPVQFAMMKRGDSALVVAVYADTAQDSTHAAALIGLTGSVSDTATSESEAGRVRRARAAWKGMMVAMETFDPTRRRDARARQWLEPPRHARGSPDVSTLLLFSADTTAPIETLDDVLKHALTDNQLRETRRLGLYWEVYGDTPDPSAAIDTLTDTAGVSADSSRDSSSVLVTVVRTDGGIMRWLGEALHLTQKNSPISVRWRDTHPEAGIASHSVTLDLARLPPGAYRVTVSIGSSTESRTEVTRDIRLR